MNFFKITILTASLLILTISCKKETQTINDSTQNNIQKESIAANYKKSEFNIKGMTCEIGCAKLIQSKLSKVDGVKFVKVSFKDSIGMVEYDVNKISSTNIITFVDKIAGGDLYKATNLTEVTKFTVK